MRLIYISLLAVAIAITGCDENDALPSYKKVGTSTHTVATITVSNAAPLPSENVTVKVSYVNPSSDPLKDVVIRVKVDAADYVDLETYNASSETKDQVIEKTFTYTAPATSASTVTFDMVISSQKEFPQVRRASFKTK